MEKQFVTYEIALAMKEFGFNEHCFAMYCRHGKPQSIGLFTGNDPSKISKISSFKLVCKAPLWQQCVDWLETKRYYINITRIFQWSPLPIKFLGWCIYIGTENPEEQLECNSYYVRHYYPTKQEAREQAVLKCIGLCKNK